MMQTRALDTMGRDGPTGSDASAESWTVRSAIRASSPFARGIAGLAVVATLATALSSRVPLAAVLPIAVLIAPAMVDVLDRRLPNRMVAAAALTGIVAAIITVVVGADIDLVAAALGSAAVAGPLLVMHLIAPRSMGFGDVKAAGVLGAAVGLVDPFYGLVALTVGSLIGAVAGLSARRATIPFGPALVAGAIVALMIAASPADASVSLESPSENSQT